MKKVLYFSDVSINGKSRGGHVNAVHSMHAFLKQNFVLNFVSLYDARNFFQVIILFFYRVESKLYRIVYELFFKTNTPCDMYKFSFILCMYMYTLTRLNKYDFVIINYIHMAYLRPYIKKGTFIILDTNDVMHLRTESYLKNGNGIVPSNSKIKKKKEIEILSKFDAVIVIQEDEFTYLSRIIPNKVILAARHFDIFESYNKISKNEIGFIGGSADFNVDGIVKFLNEIWINLPKTLSEWHLNIYGQVCDELCNNVDFNIKDYSNVYLRGKVDSVQEAYNNCNIMINPIYYGSGLKTKNVESLCNSTPLITTEVGIQGMNFTVGNAVYVYNNSHDFFNTLDLFKDIEHSNKAIRTARMLADEFFSIHACYKQLLDLMESEK